MRQCWGSPRPAELEAVFAHLLQRGFVGPKSWTSPLHLSSDRLISDDLSVRVTIGRVGESPPGIFGFETTILIRSKLVGEVERQLNLWKRDLTIVVERETNDPHIPVLSVTLGFLKWNWIPGGIPTWQVDSRTPGASTTWPADWDAFGEAFLVRVKTKIDVANCLTRPDFVERATWVKLDGVLSAFPIGYAAILLFSCDQSSVAIDLLRERIRALEAARGSGLPSRAMLAEQERCRLLLKWGDDFALRKRATH